VPWGLLLHLPGWHWEPQLDYARAHDEFVHAMGATPE